ncbi:MAG: TOMM precursor leader peptide-binding protein [Pseudomonadota bacterium]
MSLRGASFGAFAEEVLPRLTGQNTLAEISEQVAHLFDVTEVESALNTLAAQGIVVEGDGDRPALANDPIAPHLGWLAENAPEGRLAQSRLAQAHVVLLGAGGCGAVVARALVKSGLGRLTLVDAAVVRPADLSFSAVYPPDSLGHSRAASLAKALASPEDECTITAITDRPKSAEDLSSMIAEATLVLSTLDAGELAVSMMLNAACRARQMPWMTASVEGTEIVIGPGFFHQSGAPCYCCWRMREIAAAPNVDTRNAVEAFLVQQAQDLSDRREALFAAADIAGGMLAAEAITWLAGVARPALDGRFQTLRLPGLTVEKHVVLRRPDCPVCGPAGAA